MKQFLTILIVLAAIFSSCKKDKKEITLPQLTTAAITNLSLQHGDIRRHNYR